VAVQLLPLSLVGNGKDTTLQGNSLSFQDPRKFIQLTDTERSDEFIHYCTPELGIDSIFGKQDSELAFGWRCDGTVNRGRIVSIISGRAEEQQKEKLIAVKVAKLESKPILLILSPDQP
jgi:hypothetical protein